MQIDALVSIAHAQQYVLLNKGRLHLELEWSRVAAQITSISSSLWNSILSFSSFQNYDMRYVLWVASFSINQWSCKDSGKGGQSLTVPREGFNLSVIILASLLVFPMLGCRHSLLRHCNISRFPQVECTFSNILTCVLLPVGWHYLVLLALTFRYRIVL